MAHDSNPPSAAAQARLIAALAAAPAVFGPDCTHVRVLETHISYVLLTGRFAYKIKKSVNLGFLDFTTLERRLADCQQELRLNRRTAPSLYLDVVVIGGTIERPVLGGDGPVLEYAVRMVEFSQERLASRLLRRGQLTAVDIDALAATVAAFHRSVAVAPPDSVFGHPADILRIALQNFETIRRLESAVAPATEPAAELNALDALARWTEREHSRLRAVFVARRQGRFVRECHGDLHLGNIARIDGVLTPFDCIEFNDAMRWIDTLSEVAFIVMDLDDHGRGDLGQRFLNAYLEITGDYGGLPVLRFYLAYRAMVRAMVARLQAVQVAAADARPGARAAYDGYIALARAYTLEPQPAIVITHGLAGSGKTTLSQPLLERLCAVRIRTDVERKRAHGLQLTERRAEGIDRGLYAPDATEATYRHVAALARAIVEAGHVVIVDAAFLKRWQRDLFRELAAAMRVPFVIVSFVAGEAFLRERVAQRAAAAHDASDATLPVLDWQLQTQDALTAGESAHTVVYDSEAPFEHARRPAAWDAVIERIRTGQPSVGTAASIDPHPAHEPRPDPVRDQQIGADDRGNERPPADR